MSDTVHQRLVGDMNHLRDAIIDADRIGDPQRRRDVTYHLEQAQQDLGRALAALNRGQPTEAADAPHDGEVVPLAPPLPAVGAVVHLAREIDEHFSLRPEPGTSFHLLIPEGHPVTYQGEASEGGRRHRGRFTATVNIDDLILDIASVRPRFPEGAA